MNFTPPEPCHEVAPDKIGVYTDGSMKNTRCSSFSLSGAGVFWPGRDITKDHLTALEYELGYQRQCKDGVSIRTNLAGHGASSTRAELAAAIIALAHRGAVHLGSDSQAVVDKAIYLKKLISQGKEVSRPWTTQKDGDLWSIFFQVVATKGHASVRFTKVKGHATDEMVDQGRVLPEDKRGNDRADEVANEGVGIFGKDIIHLGQVYARRHHYYTTFIKKLHDHFVDAVKARNMCLKELENGCQLHDGPEDQKKITFQYPRYPEPEDGGQRKLKEMVHASHFKQVSQDNVAVADVGEH